MSLTAICTPGWSLVVVEYNGTGGPRGDGIHPPQGRLGVSIRRVVLRNELQPVEEVRSVGVNLAEKNNVLNAPGFVAHTGAVCGHDNPGERRIRGGASREQELLLEIVSEHGRGSGTQMWSPPWYGEKYVS